MKSLKQYKTWAIILSVLMMVLGIVMMIWPNVSAMAVCCLMGAICIATGVYELIRYFDLGVVGVLFRHREIIRRRVFVIFIQPPSNLCFFYQRFEHCQIRFVSY